MKNKWFIKYNIKHLFFKGYGVAGASDNNCGPWSDINNEKSRIADGVVALSIATPGLGTVQKPNLNCC